MTDAHWETFGRRLAARITDQRKGCSMQRSNWISLGSVVLLAVLLPSCLLAADWQTEWERTLAAAKKEGTLVVGIPASSELRKAIATRFKDRFGIDVELFPSRGPENVTRILNEYTAGVRYFDVFVSGGATPLSMVSAGAADDFQPYMILPEVTELKIGGWFISGRITSARSVTSMPFNATRVRLCGSTRLRSSRARFVPSTIC